MEVVRPTEQTPVPTKRKWGSLEKRSSPVALHCLQVLDSPWKVTEEWWRELVFNGDRVSDGNDVQILEMGGGDGCTTVECT